MIPIRRILCPIDFSEFSRLALDHATAIAGRYDSTVTVFNVSSVLPAAALAAGTPLLPMTPPTSGDLEALLTSMKRFADAETGSTVPMQFEIGEGDAAREILERARTMPSDLIVMGTHGRSGFQRLLLGSVTEKVIRSAPCPVLTVPRQSDDAPRVAAPVFNRIVCPVDFSDASLGALEYALSLAAGADRAHVTLVHVVEVMPAPPKTESAGEIEAKALDAYVAAAAEARKQRLEHLVPDSVRAQGTVEPVLAIGRAHREILRIATERHADVIVLGAHGFEISQLLFGSTAQQVIRQAPCPVLTVR
jgi:nucleotide-binding universal stress UspA family protein